ncbi:MAG: TIGR03617 family F420-dependent LLM class oxidoreductase [bacterium]|nr:TIGR03617 family F420-dependent LLM class oxidoreductase [bacterium]
MELDVTLTSPLLDVGREAAAYEAAGYAGAWAAETKGDPFLSVLMAATATTTIDVGTSIVVAFARSPMTVASSANDLQMASRGRFVLGLGTQVKAHIERRYSMPWSSPANRMREYILALRAIWHSWSTGEPLEFQGEFYRHDLMTPFFRPDPHPYGRPTLLLAAVGPKMTEVAGAVADGMVCHTFTTQKYLREVTVPTLTAARASVGKDMSDFQVAGLSFVATGRNDQEFEKSVRGTKRQIAFYGSTPAYRPVLELHGWGDLQQELNILARSDRWEEMEDLISDEVLEAFAVVASPDEIAGALRMRFGDIAQRISIYPPHDPDPDPALWGPVIREIVNA